MHSRSKNDSITAAFYKGRLTKDSAEIESRRQTSDVLMKLQVLMSSLTSWWNWLDSPSACSSAYEVWPWRLWRLCGRGPIAGWKAL